MSKIKYLFGFILAFAFSGCTDWVEPAIPYNDFQTGVYLRTLDRTANFNFFELPTSVFNLMIEAVDIEDGRQVQEVEVYAAHRRVQTVTPEVLMTTIPASAFVPHNVILRDVHPASGSKYPAATISITLDDVVKALGLSFDEIEGGDFFEYRLVLRTTTGFTFSNNNLSGDVSGGQYYRSPFFYRIPVVCPSDLAGTYNLSTVGWCGNVYTGQVRFVKDGNNPAYTLQVDLDGEFQDDFSLGAYRVCYGAATAPPGGGNGLRLTDACGQIAFNTSGSSPWDDNFFVEAVAVDGPVLTLEVRSSWDTTGAGDFEGGTATITRTDGTNWPPLRK